MSKKERILETISELRKFRFCGPSDDPDAQTAVTSGYRYLLIQLQRTATPFIPESMGKTLNGIEVEINNLYSAYEAHAEVDALLPDIEEIIQDLDESAFSVTTGEKLRPSKQDFTQQDHELFLKIEIDIKTKPDKYQEAGIWLDEYYDVEAFWGRKIAYYKLLDKGAQISEKNYGMIRGDCWLELAFWTIILERKMFCPLSELRHIYETEKKHLKAIEEAKDLLQISEEEADIKGITAVVDKGYYFNNKAITEAITSHLGLFGNLENGVSIKFRFLEAIDDLFKDIGEFISIENAKRILLLTWLVTDPEANDGKIKLTKFQEWTWENPVAFDRGLAHSLLPYEKWMHFTSLAWAKCKAEASVSNENNKIKTITYPKKKAEQLSEQAVKKNIKKKEENDDDGNTWIPKTYGDYKRLSIAIADELVNNTKESTTKEIDMILSCVRNALSDLRAILTNIYMSLHHPEVNYRHAGSTVWINDKRIEYRLTDSIIFHYMSLFEFVRRVKFDYSSYDNFRQEFYKKWPKDPKAVAFTSAGWSILEAVFYFLSNISASISKDLELIYWDNSEGDNHFQTEANWEGYDDLIICPEQDKIIRIWRERLISLFNSTFSPEKWPLLEREFDTINCQLEYEYEQAMLIAKPESEELEWPQDKVQIIEEIGNELTKGKKKSDAVRDVIGRHKKLGASMFNRIRQAYNRNTAKK